MKKLFLCVSILALLNVSADAISITNNLPQQERVGFFSEDFPEKYLVHVVLPGQQQVSIKALLKDIQVDMRSHGNLNQTKISVTHRRFLCSGDIVVTSGADPKYLDKSTSVILNYNPHTHEPSCEVAQVHD